MANFADFPQANKTLRGDHLPQTPTTVGSLPVFQQAPKEAQDEYNRQMVAEGRPELQINYPDGPALCISAWQPTEEERAAIAAGGLIYLHCLGYTHGPISVQGVSPWPAPPAETPKE